MLSPIDVFSMSDGRSESSGFFFFCVFFFSSESAAAHRSLQLHDRSFPCPYRLGERKRCELRPVRAVACVVSFCRGWPVCTLSFTARHSCKPSSQTTDNGWGWEEKSCVVRNTAAERQECPGGSTGSASSLPGGLDDGRSAQAPSSTVSADCASVALPSCPHGLRCGCEQSDTLGRNKRRLVALGASPEFLASAMMETSSLSTDYAFGDNKSYDSFNAGLCKQNWGQSRRCYAPWRRFGPQDYRRMAEMNSNERLDIAVYRACSVGRQTAFLVNHRGRCPGMSPNQVRADQQRFIDVWKWTLDLARDHMTDNLRFWVQVPAC